MSKSKKKPNNPPYITTDDCERRMTPVVEDIAVIKKALVGDDLRGGLVKEIAEMNAKMNGIVTNHNKQASNTAIKADLSSKWKLGIFAAIVTGMVALVNILKDIFLKN